MVLANWILMTLLTLHPARAQLCSHWIQLPLCLQFSVLFSGPLPLPLSPLLCSLFPAVPLAKPSSSFRLQGHFLRLAFPFPEALLAAPPLGPHVPSSS